MNIKKFKLIKQHLTDHHLNCDVYVAIRNCFSNTYNHHRLLFYIVIYSTSFSNCNWWCLHDVFEAIVLQIPSTIDMTISCCFIYLIPWQNSFVYFLYIIVYRSKNPRENWLAFLFLIGSELKKMVFLSECFGSELVISGHMVNLLSANLIKTMFRMNHQIVYHSAPNTCSQTKKKNAKI